MHDPQILVFSNFLFDIWHVDPEVDGTDNSCGWTFPRLTPKQKQSLQFSASLEAERPWIMAERSENPTSPADAEARLREVLLDAAQTLGIKVTWEEICLASCDLLCNPIDNVRNLLCFKPGYHSNFKVDHDSYRLDNAETIWYICGRYWLRKRRRWWQHPRWHIWHWKINIKPLQRLKRWLFTRCCKCGKKFAWSEAPMSSGRSKGPRWFRSEEGLYHSNCRGAVFSSSTGSNPARAQK